MSVGGLVVVRLTEKIRVPQTIHYWDARHGSRTFSALNKDKPDRREITLRKVKVDQCERSVNVLGVVTL